MLHGPFNIVYCDFIKFLFRITKPKESLTLEKIFARRKKVSQAPGLCHKNHNSFVGLML